MAPRPSINARSHVGVMAMSVPYTPPPPKRRSDAWLAIGVVLVALLIIGAAWVVMSLPREPEKVIPPNIEWPKDSDGDLYPDIEDAFPNDPNEWADSNQNGIGDNSEAFLADTDEDGYNDLVDLKDGMDAGILIELKSAKVIDEVDLLTGMAEIYFNIRINDRQEARIDDAGYPYILEIGSYFYIGKSLRFNADDNRRYTKISIEVVDEDFTSGDDPVDIDGVNLGDKRMDLIFDLVNGTWFGDDAQGLADGSFDGTNASDDDDGALSYDISVVPISGLKDYHWPYGGIDFEMQLNLSARDYYQLKYSDVDRWPSTYDEARTFVTIDDPAVMAAASELEGMASQLGLTDLERANFVLSFVQSIDYSFDNVSAGANEYWRFPLETLYDQTGDCEDTSILYASIVEAMGFDAVLLLLPGHMAVGLSCQGATGGHYYFESVNYYYCETTGPGWEVGEVPPEMRQAEVDAI
ncbi:MAG TPA: hypothetical protein VLU38_06310, partial [Methanomassiliicoccales archaeon]|nr:hypothetical protein [Methanomassiliicoccales archaeon]